MRFVFLPYFLFVSNLLDARFFIEFPARDRRYISSLPIRSVSLADVRPWSVKPIVLGELDTSWDTRQEIGLREDYVIFFPRPYTPDRSCKDIFSRPQFRMSAAGTTLGAACIGPLSPVAMAGIVAVDFLGPTEVSLSGLRCLFALGILKWDWGALLFGQYWHPLIIPVCSPQTVSYNLGSPFEPRSRVPQCKFGFNIGEFQCYVTAASQNFPIVSSGPIGLSSTYNRNALIPNIDVELRRTFGAHHAGVGFDYLRLVPRLRSNRCIKVDEVNTSFIAQAWAAFNFPQFSTRMKLLYAQNGSAQALISGYGVHNIDRGTDQRTYTNSACLSGWMDSSYVLPSLTSELGLFIGGTKNLGAQRSLVLDKRTHQPIVYNTIPVINQVSTVLRISPRYILMHDPLRFGLEIEATRATFGNPDRRARIHHAKPVNNVRVLASLFFFY